MPKIYGKTELEERRGLVKCKVCNNVWPANKDELDAFANKLQVTCIYCRGVNDLKVGQRIPKNTEYQFAGGIKQKDILEFRGDGYKDKYGSVVHLRCNRQFFCKLINMRQGNIQCPYCYGKSEGNMEAPQLLGKKLVNSVNTAKKIEYIPKKQKQTDIIYNQLAANGIRLLKSNNNTDLIVQCSRCGLEITKDKNSVRGTISSGKFEICERCAKKVPTLEELKKAYLGKIYNGLKIDKIYYGDRKEVMCDAFCVTRRMHQTAESYAGTLKERNFLYINGSPQDQIEEYEKLLLVDVINRRCHCKCCSDLLALNVPAFKDVITCKFRYTGVDLGLGVNPASGVDVSTINIGELYDCATKNGVDSTLCKFCKHKDKCKMAGSIRNSIKNELALKDLKDNRLSVLLDIERDYSKMFEFSKFDSSGLQILEESDLIVIKDAYYDKNGVLYKTCKCLKHGTELTLSELEIAQFEHKQCIENDPSMRFFDMPSNIYLTKKT